MIISQIISQKHVLNPPFWRLSTSPAARGQSFSPVLRRRSRWRHVMAMTALTPWRGSQVKGSSADSLSFQCFVYVESCCITVGCRSCSWCCCRSCSISQLAQQPKVVSHIIWATNQMQINADQMPNIICLGMPRVMSATEGLEGFVHGGWATSMNQGWAKLHSIQESCKIHDFTSVKLWCHLLPESYGGQLRSFLWSFNQEIANFTTNQSGISGIFGLLEPTHAHMSKSLLEWNFPGNHLSHVRPVDIFLATDWHDLGSVPFLRDTKAWWP